jgi:hypothetical protein
VLQWTKTCNAGFGNEQEVRFDEHNDCRES